MASASLLLWKPSPSDKKEEVNASENLILAGLEEECPGEVVIGASEQPDIAHFRAHYLSDETSAVPQLQIGFVARRPSLEFRYDLNDTGVYVLQPWIFDYIILEEEISFSKSLYGIAHLQHCKINRRPSCEGAAKWPAEILQGLLPEDTAAEVAPPMHWAVASQDFRSADTARFYGASFNSMQSVMPSQWDTFRIAATVVADKADARRRVVRINNAVDLALATADVAVGLHYQVANATMQVAQPRVLCNDFYAMMLATFVDDLKFKRGLAAQSTLKTSIVLLDPKMLGKGTYTDGAYIARTAQVGDKVSLLNCVVMEGAVVGNGCKLKYCVVKPGITVPPNTQELGKVFSE